MRKLFAIIPALALLVFAGACDEASESVLSPDESFARLAADKATGEAWTMRSDDAGPFYIRFNAHEAILNRAAKGDLYWENVDAGNYFSVDVTCVFVDGSYAYFGGALYDINSSWMLDNNKTHAAYVVYDGGTPGSAGDYLQAKYLESQAELDGFCGDPQGYNFGSLTYWAYEGNFTVHTY